jgi:hypothetical protein
MVETFLEPGWLGGWDGVDEKRFSTFVINKIGDERVLVAIVLGEEVMKNAFIDHMVKKGSAKVIMNTDDHIRRLSAFCAPYYRKLTLYIQFQL